MRTPVILACILFGIAPVAGTGQLRDDGDDLRALLPTGKRITPTAAPGSRFEPLNPELPGYPDFVAGQAISTAVSPNKQTLLILTSGYNRINGADGKPIQDLSDEYVFAYDISRDVP
ncbi:MAG: hypothetical protein WB992_06235 [Bryobacteraceae bacterium]